MKVILYIGHHKVGSTALQVFLAQNWLRLIRAGILYPSVDARGFAYNLARTLEADDMPAPANVNIREPHSALAYRMMSEVSDRRVPAQFKTLPSAGQMFIALRQQIRRLHPETVILCSEAFANFGQVQPALIGQLCSAFPQAEFEIYCALRRPDDYLISWHGQRLKVGERLKSLAGGGTAPYFDTIHFNFRAVIEAWVQELPQARVMIRNYSDILAAGGSAEDFMQQCGTGFPDDMVPAGRANASLSRAAMEIVRRANHDLEPPAAHALCQYLLTCGDRLIPVANGEVEMFGPEIRADLAERFAPVQEYLSALTGQAAFFPDIDEVARPRPVPESEATADLLGQIDPQTLPDDTLRAYVGELRRGDTE